MIEVAVFVVAAAACLIGAVGVVVSRNPVYAALSLVGTLFGIAVLFVAQEANFLAAVQVIVYAGAIVVLFLFVIMFLGVDRSENLAVEPLGPGQRIAAATLGTGIVALVIAALYDSDWQATGIRSGVGPLKDGARPDINLLGEAIFTRYLYAFEVTSALLVIAVVGAVLLARRAPAGEEIIDAGQEEREQELFERLARAEGLVPADEDDEPQDEAEDTDEETESESVKA